MIFSLRGQASPEEATSGACSTAFSAQTRIENRWLFKENIGYGDRV